MKEDTFLNEDVLVHRAVSALIKSLGPIEAKRFLSLHNERKRIESVKRHQKWQTKLHRDKFLKDLAL